MKKLLSFLLAFTLVAGVSCSEKSESESESGTVTDTAEIRQTAFKETKVPVSEEIKNPVAIKSFGGKCYCFYETLKGMLHLAILESDNTISKETDLLEPVGYGFSICMNEKGGFYIFAPVTDFPIEKNEVGAIENFKDFQENGELDFILYEYDSEGNLTSENEVIGFNKCFNKSHSQLTDMCPYGKDKLIVSLFDTLVIIGTDGSVVDAVQKEMQGFRLGCDRDGNVIISNMTNYAQMDGETLKLPDDLNKDFNVENGTIDSHAVAGDDQFAAYFLKQNGIYGVNFGEDPVLVFDFPTSFVKSSDFSQFTYCDEKFISLGMEIRVYERRPDDYSSDREVIEIWQISGGDDGGDAIDFSKSNDKYTAKVAIGLKSPDDLVKAVLTGKGPDVIEFGDAELLRKLDNLGALADMNKLMDEYGGVSREQLMPNVLEAFDMDGRILALPEFFMVKMIPVDKEAFGRNDNYWNYEDLYRMTENRRDGAYISTTWCDILYLFVNSNLSYWIDLKNATDKFDTPEFVKLLEFMKNTENICPDGWASDEEQYMTRKEMYHAFKDKDAFIIESNYEGAGMGLDHYLSTLGEYGIDFDEAEMLNAIGMTDKGVMEVNNCFGVLESSDCKEGAWAYVSYMLNEENQCSHAKDGGSFMWTNKKAFNIALNNSIKDDGEPKMGKTGVSYSNDLHIEVDYPCTVTSKQAEKYRDFVMNCTVMESYNSDVDGIIWDEYERFKKDEITAQQCADFIHNRVNIYLNEIK